MIEVSLPPPSVCLTYSGTTKDSEVKILSLTVCLRREDQIQRDSGKLNSFSGRFYAINYVAVAAQNFFLVRVRVSLLVQSKFCNVINHNKNFSHFLSN